MPEPMEACRRTLLHELEPRDCETWMNEPPVGDPLVSIGMPVRNGGQFIRQALDSLLAQTYERFELIISDNASTDGTQPTCLEYASTDPRVRYHRNAEDIGMARNFNRVFDLSSGSYFFWAAHDDLWDENFISRCVEVLQCTPSAVLCYPQAKFIGPAGEPIDFAFPSFDTSRTSATGMDLVSRLHVHMWGVTYPFPVKGLMRAEALAATRLAQDKLNFDLHLLIELSLLGEFAHVPTPLFYNRLRREGDTLAQLAELTRDVGKSVSTKRSALYLCAEMVFGNAQAVNRHAPSLRHKALLIPSAVFCTLVKYNWLMRSLLDLARRNQGQQLPSQPTAGAEVEAGHLGAGEASAAPVRLGPDAKGPGKLGAWLRIGARGGRRVRRRDDEVAVTSGDRDLEGSLEGLRERLEEMQAQLGERLDALEDQLSEVVAGMELGSVPARQTTYLGHPFVYPYDSALGQVIVNGHEWDAVLRTVIPELVRKDQPVIWEVGGNIGASLHQIMAAKPRARVVVFEPSRRFRPFLERNIELAGFGQVEVLPLFLGREPGQSTWLYGSGTTAGVVPETRDLLGDMPGYEPRGRELVHATTLDEVRRGRQPVDFLKVDTDGIDLEVLRGAAAMLAQDRPVIFFELTPGLAERVPTPVGEDLAWLQRLGYRRLACFNPRGELLGMTEDPAQALAWAEANVYCDVLSCFRGSAARARLAGIELALSGSV